MLGALGLVLLLFASQASFALARNVKLSDVLWSRSPGTGPWLEALLFAAGGVLPGPIAGGERGANWRAGVRRFAVVGLGRVGDVLLRRGEHRNARQHERQGEQVGDGYAGPSAQ